MMRRYFWDIVKLAVVISVFALLYKSGQIDTETLKLAAARPGLVLAAAVLVFMAILFNVERWRRLLRAIDVDIPFGPAFNLTFIGVFFSMALPGAVGGDIVKAYYIAKGQSQRAALVTTVIFDRVLGLYTMICVATFAGAAVWSYVLISGAPPEWWNGPVKAMILFTFALFTSFTVGTALFMSDRMSKTRLMIWIMEKAPFRDKVEKIYTALRAFGDRPGITLAASGVSFTGQLFLYAAIWILAMALEIKELTVTQFLFVIPICILINAIPVAPGGLGVGEIGFGAVLALFGSGKGVELAVMYHAVSISLGILFGGTLYLLYSRKEGSMVSLTRLENYERENGPR